MPALNLPIALRNASANTSVFLTSALYTSDPTIGQNGTFTPSSCDTANASAVFPVPGAPTSKRARPENLRDLMRSTTTPHAYEHSVTNDACRIDDTHLTSILLADESGIVCKCKSFRVEP